MTLATALALPYTTDDGQPFPHRDLIIYLAFCVIFATLVGQGGTLPRLIRWLRFPENPVDDQRFRAMLGQVLDAGILRFDELQSTGDAALDGAQQVRQQLERRRAALQRGNDRPNGAASEDRDAVSRLTYEIEEAERATIRQLAAGGEISNSVRRQLEERLDLQQVGRDVTR